MVQFGQNSDHKSKVPLHNLVLDDLVIRAQKPLGARPRPFLKWAGSKQSILKHIVPLLPKRFKTYYEPFLGSGALFFLLQPKSAIITDNCSDLIQTFEAVQQNVSAVLRYLHPLQHTTQPRKELFYEVRRNRSTGRFKRAAEFIFLNKTCWNGLYRVNSDGQFNVPYGLPKSNSLVDPRNLRDCAIALNAERVRLGAMDFEQSLSSVSRGDLVYLDPPYVTRHNNNGFRDWNENLFSWEDQKRLARVAKDLARSGATVIVSNAHHLEVRDLYPNFVAKSISRYSTLASDSSKRVPVTEMVLHSS